MNHKEITAHIRKRLKHAAVPCRVMMDESCGYKYVKVVTPTYDARWTPEQLRTIGLVAMVNKLTFVNGMPVHGESTIMKLTEANQFDFVFNA